VLAPIPLPRGASLHAEEVERARSFTAGFWFPIGSRHEAPRERGFVHFVEHLLFKGTATRSALDIARAIDRVGGYLNAFTERDVLCVHCTVPASRWKLALEVLADLSFHSTFPPEEVEKEREVIESEILASLDEPEELAHDLFLREFWKDDPLALPIAGEVDDIEAADRDRLFAFYRRRLRPENLLVTAAGPVATAEAADFLSSLIRDCEPGPEDWSPLPPTREPTFFPTVSQAQASLSQVYLFVAIPLHPPFGPEDYYTLSALNGAFGESMSSRLFQGLRERDGLCYSVASGFSLGSSEGLWMAQASSSVRSFPRLLAALEEEIGLIGGPAPLTEEELAESLSRLEGSFDLSLDDTEYRMKRLARQALQATEVLDVEETRRMILGVEASSVGAMTRRLFAAPERAVFAYGKLGERGIKALTDSASRAAGRLAIA